MSSKGFSLVELSIVLVILGLLTGGILTGQNLIRAAELRSVTADQASFNSAVNSFKDKYFARPGDMTIATRFWPASANGDGNGQIDYLGGGAGEEYRAWQHMANAGLIEGSYTGGIDSLPRGKLSNSLYRISNQFGVYTSNGLMLSVNSLNGTTGYANRAILRPEEVYSIDVKLDDGQADSGSVMGFNEQGVPGCVTNDYTVGFGDYILNNDSVACKVFFVIGR